MKFKKKLIILITIITLVLSCSIGVFAYITNSFKSPNTTITTNITTEKAVSVTDFTSLFNASKEEYYNNGEYTSTTRKIIRLQNDVTLVNNLIITADVHIDLNSHKLILNNYDLSINHGFSGCFTMYNGTIVSTGGEVVLNLPKASYEIKSVSYSNGTDSIDSVVNVVSLNQKYSAYNALYYVGMALDSNVTERPEIKDISAVTPDSFELTADKFILLKNICALAEDSEACTYVYKDLDLPNHYLSKDIKITYTSDNTDYLDEYGNVTIPSSATGSASVTLTATISSSIWEESISCSFTVHVVNLDNVTINDKVSESIIKAILQRYYVNEGLKIKNEEILPDYYYDFTHGITLPISLCDGKITYDYSNTNLNGNSVNTASTTSTVFEFEPNSSCYHLLIELKSGKKLNLQMYSTYVGNYETYSKKILNILYGGSIVYDTSFQKVDLKDETDSSIASLATKYELTSITYELKEETDASSQYEIVNKTLKAKSGVTPDPKVEYMTVTFTYGAVECSYDIYIVCITGSGNTASSFLPYYNMYDAKIPSSIQGEYALPFAYSNLGPYMVYDFVIKGDIQTETINGSVVEYYDVSNKKIPDGLNVKLYYNGNYRYTFNKETNMVNQLKSYLSTNGLSISTLAAYDDIEYRLTIDSSTLSINDTKLLLLYNYSFDGNEWQLYQSTVLDENDVKHLYTTTLTCSSFTLEGGLVYGEASASRTNVIVDSTFFAWLYNNLKADSESPNITASNASSVIIVNDWLSQDITLDASSGSLSGVTDFTGVNNLIGAKHVILNGINMSSLLSGIAQMKSVEVLKLSNCSLSSVSALASMSSVKELWIDNNTISTFDELLEMKSLETVYLYRNTGSSSYYGSTGICNYQVFDDLRNNGVNVYNTININSVPLLFENVTENNDYWKLKNIEYQSILSKNVSIETLYAKFKALTANNIGLKSNTSGTLTWKYQTGKSVYEAEYFYVEYKIDNSTILRVKYYVDRY